MLVDFERLTTMPVDDSSLLTQQNSNSSGLSVEAREFIPKINSDVAVTSIGEGPEGNSGSRRKPSGTMPKNQQSSTYFKDNRRGGRNYQPAPRFHNRNERFEIAHDSIEMDCANSAIAVKKSPSERKFFQDNQKTYSNGNSRNDSSRFSNENRIEVDFKGTGRNDEGLRKKDDRGVRREEKGGRRDDRNLRNNEKSSWRADQGATRNEEPSRNFEGVKRNFHVSNENFEGLAKNGEGTNRNYEENNRNNDGNHRNYERSHRNYEGTSRNSQRSSKNFDGTSRNFEESRNNLATNRNNEFARREVTSHQRNNGESRRDDGNYYNKNPRNRYDYDNHSRKPEKRPENSRKPSNRFKKENSIEPSMILQREQMIKDIESNTLECMICCEKIRDHQSTWNCSNCFHIQHFNCIKTWISNSKTEFGEWRCVACQTVRKEIPRDYFCFCGKSKYPSVNRNDLAHSCGEMCGRTDNCPHPCTLRCHPGPHAICQSFVERSCGCGKTKKTYQCSMKETFECELTCEKILNCGVHKCQENCHQDECKPCEASIEMKCHCGKDSKTEICNSENFFVTKYSCEKSCDLLLSCGNHQCKLICHPENCKSCLLSPEFVKTCPCGRTLVETSKRKFCTDPVPLCKSQCPKSLKCGPLSSPHTCTKPCHLSDCPPCSKSTNVKCRCGRIEEKIACKDLQSTDVRCKKKCTKFRSCGKHKCNQNCCIELEHICSQQCGRSLECKKHRCQLPCHIGNCLSCPRVSFDELHCECGAVVVYPPVPCGTKTPECKNKCKRTHKCSHPVNHLCHSEVECPPCVFLTAKFCYGKHEQRKTIPCNEDSFSCGMPCGKGLSCGRHKCIKNCHLGACEKATDVCKQLCTTKRPECEHNCNMPCHEDTCPEKACRFQVEVSCLCGNVREMKSCEQVAYENKKIQRVKLAMQMQEGGNVDMRDIELSGKRTLKILECNDECKTLERNRRLEIAFKVENPNLLSYPKFVPNYTEFIRTFYKKEPVFANMLFDKLTELVKLAKESKQKSRSHSFPVMNRDKRHAVHDLAAMFGVETVAYDAEPNRNVVATASRECVS